MHELAFVIPARMGWPLPVYELALMSAGRAFDMDVELAVTIVTPEDRPLAIFGEAASTAVEARLASAKVSVFTSAYAEIPAAGEIVIGPGERVLSAQRIVALPELYGPPIRGLPSGEHGFLRADEHGRLHDVGPVYAAGDATDFPIKHGGLASQQADAVAESIAALAGAADHAGAVQAGDQGDAAHGLQAPVPLRAHHRRLRIQLGGLRDAAGVIPHEDQPRATSRRTCSSRTHSPPERASAACAVSVRGRSE